MSAGKTDALKAALCGQVEAVVLALLGEADRGMSTKRQLRFGRHGSLCVEIAGDKAGVWHCFESGEGGDILDLVKRTRQTRTFPETVEAAAALIGAPMTRRPATTAQLTGARRIELERIERPANIWRETVAAKGTPVELYLRGRGLDLIDCQDIRYHPDCPRRAERCPAMVCAMRSIDDGHGTAIHRTFLNLDGTKAKRGPDDSGKAMLGTAKGAAIMLSRFQDVTGGLFVCEGVEDGIAAILGGWSPTWALGSAGAIRTFPVLGGIECLTIIADRDPAGIEAADACGARWAAAGREVRIIEPVAAKDWNELQAVA